MLKKKLSLIAMMGAALLMSTVSYSQTIESVTFSSVASSNDNFQPVVGSPYSASLIGANGSLEISASYGESSYEESTLSAQELKLQSSIRVFPNPSTYQVNVDLSQLPQVEYNLYLLDLNGKELYNQTTTDTNIQLDMSAFANGTYILNVQVKNTQKVGVFKIFKSK
jgi:hypothetical protein